MALPVAPLGSLPSMNLPYSRQYYDKTSAVDKALSAFLVGLIGQAGSQMTENVMQRDFAEKPAGFMSKLVKGPQETRQQFEAKQGRQAEMDSQAARIKSAEGIAEADRFSAESRTARQLADNEDDRGLKRTLADLSADQARQQQIYDWTQRQELQGRSAKDARQQSLYEMGLSAQLGASRSAEDRATRSALMREEAKLRDQSNLKDIGYKTGARMVADENAANLYDMQPGGSSSGPTAQDRAAYQKVPREQDDAVVRQMQARGESPEMIRRFLEKPAYSTKPTAMQFAGEMADSVPGQIIRDVALANPVATIPLLKDAITKYFLNQQSSP